MSNIHAMEAGELRSTLVKIKDILDSNCRPADAISEIKYLLDNEKPLRYDPLPFPEHIDNQQVKLVIRKWHLRSKPNYGT